jgi:predicted DNA-binding transcriptional regulator AlpA
MSRVNRDQIAEMIGAGVTKEYVRKRLEPRPDFPRPSMRLSPQRVFWETADVKQWIERERNRA